MRYSILLVGTTALIFPITHAFCQFTGAYAPNTWTITGAGIGGSSAVFSGDGLSLTITGSDGGLAADTDVVHTVLTEGTWSFDWSYVSGNYHGFDNAYYLINGTAFILSLGSFVPETGSERVKVQAGDVIGWRVDTVDGIFGPGVLTITNFQIPAPGALALLGLVGVARHRRRHVEISGHP